MSKTPLGPAFVLLAGLSACVYVGPEEPDGPFPPVVEPTTCAAEGMQGLVGQNRRVLDAMLLPERTRVIGPGQPVTMDFLPSRLNISYDRAGRIDRVFCG